MEDEIITNLKIDTDKLRKLKTTDSKIDTLKKLYFPFEPIEAGEIDKGKLLFTEHEEIYRRNLLRGKIPFYFFVLFPIGATIYLILNTQKVDFVVLGLIWGTCYLLPMPILMPLAFARRLTIYENGFVPSKLPITCILTKEKKNFFIRYRDIRAAVLSIPKANQSKVYMITVHRKDGVHVVLEKGWVDEITLSQLAKVLREKIPENVKELQDRLLGTQRIK